MTARAVGRRDVVDRIRRLAGRVVRTARRVHHPAEALSEWRATRPPLVHIDGPLGPPATGQPYVLVAGWIAADQPDHVADVCVVDGAGMPIDMVTVRRPDAEASHPERHVVGFQRLFPMDEVAATGGLRLRATAGALRVDHELLAPGSPGAADAVAAAVALRSAKARKAARIRPLLRCPRCSGRELLDGRDGLTCARCASTYPVIDGRPLDFLPADVRDRFRISSTERISAWGYDERASAILERHHGGIVLDCGCGLRPEYLDQVVNYEVVDYPTTDVLGVGQSLPFVDGAFDAVFSFAVLEHVTDPFRCAAELVRVLKPGGTLFAVVPFLQPFHGYPDHYFNMTESGLRQLFDGELEIESCEVPAPGAPIFALSWMLNSYAQGLPPDVAARFERMTVRELLAEPATLAGDDIVRRLAPEAIRELAATNALVARKPC